MRPKRGEVWLTRLDPVEGSEQGKTRPCLVVSPSAFTPYDLVIIAPLTSGGRAAAYRPPLIFRNRSGFVLPEHVRSVACSRLIRRLGSVQPPVTRATLAVLREMFAD